MLTDNEQECLAVLRDINRSERFGTLMDWADVVDWAAFGYVEAYETPGRRMWCKLKPAGTAELSRLEAME